MLPKGDLAPVQREMIETLASKLSITISAAGLLLRHFRWDEEALTKAWSADAPGTAKKANVTAVLRQVMAAPADPEKTTQCGVCFDDVKEGLTFAMKCGHRFCIPCWKDYLKNTIDAGASSGGNCLNTNCPGFKCKELVGEQIYEMLVDDAAFKKYRDTQLLSFVDDNDSICWCPGKGCGNVIAFSKRKMTVYCTCGQRFCFKCKSEAHAPTTCKEV